MTKKPVLPLANPAPSTALASFLTPQKPDSFDRFDREIEAMSAKVRAGILETMHGPQERAAFVLMVLDLARDAARTAKEARQERAAALREVRETEATRQRVEAAFTAWADAHGVDLREEPPCPPSAA